MAAAPLRHLNQVALAGSRALMVTLYAATALLGLVVTPLHTLVLLSPLLALVAVTVAVTTHRLLRPGWPGPRTVWTAALTGAALLPFRQTTLLLGGAEAGITLTLLALAVLNATTALPFLTRPSTTPPGEHAQALPDAGDAFAPDAGDTSLRELLELLPLQALLSEWQESARATAHLSSGPRYTAAAHLRELLIDELRHRDPAGMAHWSSHGATGSPGPHLHDDHDLPT